MIGAYLTARAQREAERAAARVEQAQRRAHYRYLLQAWASAIVYEDPYIYTVHRDCKVMVAIWSSRPDAHLHQVTFGHKALPWKWSLKREVVDIYAWMDPHTFDVRFWRVVERPTCIPKVGVDPGAPAPGGEHKPAATTGSADIMASGQMPTQGETHDRDV